MTDLQTLKSRISCLDYAVRIGLPVSKPGDRCVSPLRQSADNQTAFVVHTDYFYDFVSQQSGDVIDLCALTRYDGDRGAAIRYLSEITGTRTESGTQSSANWVRHTQNLNNLIHLWHESLRDCDRDYLYSRRITDETITALKIGYDAKTNRITIPYWKNGYIASYIARATLPDQMPKYIKRKNDESSDRSVVWGLNTIRSANTEKTEHLIIAEGAFDAISFYQSGYPVLATMGGHFSREQLSAVIFIARNFKRVFLCFDSDAAGTKFTESLAKTLFSYRIAFVIGNLPHGVKDVSEYYAAGNALENLIETAKPGLPALVQTITDKQEFTSFVMQAARYVSKPELTELFRAVPADTFPSDWLAETKKIAMQSPSEHTIAREISKKYQLLYKLNVGFYEYHAGCWRFRDDQHIKSYIADALGHYRTGQKLNSIINLVKTDCITTSDFDRNRVFCFINGTLDLDTFDFREHRPSDMCSVQVNYPYDPSANSQAWTDFVAQICNYDAARENLLNEMAGYILYPDCSLEKLFVLTGEGGNGKSKFLEIIKLVFGSENCTAVTVGGLCQDFQRIQLSKSLLNIAPEIKSDLTGSEEYLKQLASGEEMSACFKGKDYINFRPRCKMLFACNGQLQSKDTSKGLERRLCIVNFECQFVDDPDPENPLQYRKDTELLGKLSKNLSAIFNWALDGYRNLRMLKQFSEPEDQTQLMEDFREASNPLITFIDDENIASIERITNEILYERYKNWCVIAGHKQRSRRSFLAEFCKIVPKNLRKVDSFREGNRFRGFEMVSSIEPEIIAEEQQKII